MISFSTTVLDQTLIDTRDVTFQISTPRAIDDLIQSIQHIGLLNPPTVLQKEGRCIIVSGFRRIEALRRLDHEQIPARVLPLDSPLLDCTRIAIADNLTHRELDLLEISRSLVLLSSCIDDPLEMSAEARDLGLPGNIKFIKKVFRFGQLPGMIQEGICQGRISLNMALDLQALEKSVANLLAKLYIELKINQNKQKEIITLLREIAIREKLTIQAVLESEDVATLMVDTEMNNQQKTNTIRSNLRKRRFPNLWRAEERFQRKLRQLKLDNSIQLQPSDNFEDTSLRIKLSFKNKAELAKQITVLNKILNDSHLDKLLER
jgi:ParB family transcriptional regulator, chromosome partitioning protein